MTEKPEQTQGKANGIGIKANTLITVLFGLLLSANATTYYVSSSTGNDINNGTSSSTPWQTFTNISTLDYGSGFQPGDSVLLKCGDSWDGPLYIRQAGTSGSPITVSSYGNGAKPIMYGNHPSITWTSVPGHAGYYAGAFNHQ